MNATLQIARTNASIFFADKPADMSLYEWAFHPANPYSLPPLCKKMLDIVIRNARRLGFTFFYQRTLAQWISITQRYAKRFLHWLKALGLIREEKAGRCNHYYLGVGIFDKQIDASSPMSSPMSSPIVDEKSSVNASNSKVFETREKSDMIYLRDQDIRKDTPQAGVYSSPVQYEKPKPEKAPPRSQSKFSLKQCIQFAISLMTSGIHTPKAYGASIWRDGREDDRMADFFKEKPISSPHITDATTLVLTGTPDKHCSSCYGLGIRYADNPNSWLDGEVLPCECRH